MAIKKTTAVAAALAALALGWAYTTYPAIGQLTYDVTAGIESRLYGLHKEVVTVEGIPMTLYRSSSQGPAIVMIHGFSADKDVWARFARHFSGHYQVIIPDLPGHGETGFKPEWSYTIEAQTRRIAALMDQLQIKQAHIIGNSMGGFITAQFAVSYPQRTLSAGLVDPAGLPSPHPSEMRVMLSQGQNPFVFSTREGFHRFYPMTMASPPFMPGYVLDAMADRYIARRDQLTQIFAESHKETDLPVRIREVKVPVILMWGKQDRLIDVSSVPVWQAALPQAQVHVWDGIGHMPMVETPAVTAEAYQRFLSGL
ncbi:MAG TPA: alpha/beta hydrolase [Aquabacterium sp.]|uniref:alpha/beta fold hydrolase n=1 Tax=Aquabacterium sp. TaxID=1872578 RepID=UPI002E34443D|nr:alpha/beta hydrolase [Aquabacterium sp.]HEX5356264.1 alpha/beta hydrolase [Aquabacterium sp.]